MSHRELSPQGAAPSLEELCDTALQLQIAGRADLAEPIYKSVLLQHPTHGAANHCLGLLLVQAHRTAQALPHLLAALEASPHLADYWLGYLEALLLLGQTAQAAQTLTLARHHGLAGNAVEEFSNRLDVVVAQPPASPGTRRREAQAIGREEAAVLALVKEGRFRDALPLARAMTERFAHHGVGWKLLGAMLWAADAPEPALEAMRTSVTLLPGDAEAHNNLGTALTKLRRLDEAEGWLQRALAIDATFTAAHTQLADNLQLQGRYAEAEASFRRAITLSPHDFSAEGDAPHSGLLFMLNHNPDVTADDLFAEHRRVGDYLERSAARSPVQISTHFHVDASDTERCLQIGFVSADLRNHAVASFIEPLLHHWATHRTVRVSVYHCHPTEDVVSERLRLLVTRWRHVFGLSNLQLAQLIADDRIDVLIDLAGHTSMHRLGAFAHKPAPVQASWLGYPATTGLQSMDYYLTDRHFFPPGQFDRYFTEKLAYLPAVWPFMPFDAAPPLCRLPALENGCLTFGSFNRLGKINKTTIQLWSALLCAVPTAHMLIAGVPLEHQHRQLIEWFGTSGVAPERLAFHPWTDLQTHLALHQRVDIALETTPYTGCTTSNHALWMGLPTLTLAGATPASRLCAANLGHLDLNEFVASTAEDFVAKGSHWAQHVDALAQLRAGLRDRWRASPARDPAFVADGMERAFRHMWRRRCAGLPPETFEA